MMILFILFKLLSNYILNNTINTTSTLNKLKMDEFNIYLIISPKECKIDQNLLKITKKLPYQKT